MSEDSYTEVTSESWFGRIGSSIMGVLIGFVLLAVSVGLLFWNEGRTVKTYKMLKEGAGVVITVPSDSVDRSNDGKLVHMTGMATTTEILRDSQFPVSSNALALRRSVKMYQWRENKSSEKRKKLGGGEETVTTYSYEKTWSSSLIDSSRFKKSSSHRNPGRMLFENRNVTARNATIGAFRLTSGQVGGIQNYEALTAEAGSELPRTGKPIHASQGGYYIGNNESAPEIGDMIITFAHVPPTDVTLVAMQRGNSFAPYKTKAGGTIDDIETGILTAEEMFEKLQSSNSILGWILRLVGVVLMFIGFALIFKPLSVIADLVPFVGNIVEFGTGIIAFILTMTISLTVIAIAWIFYRPVLAIGLIVIAVGITGFIIWSKKGKSGPAPVKHVEPVQKKTPGETSEPADAGDAFGYENEVASSSGKKEIEDPFLTDDDK